VERFFSWCDALWPELYEDTPIHDRVRYARIQREGLARFLLDGRLPIHNNASDLNLRRQAVGRIFVDSDDGGRANAVFTSLLASCRMLEVEPWAYLRDVLCLLPRWCRTASSSSRPSTGLARATLPDVRDFDSSRRRSSNAF
jgi:hypothetical protein